MTEQFHTLSGNHHAAGRVHTCVDDGATISMPLTRMNEVRESSHERPGPQADAVCDEDERGLIARARSDRRAFAPLYLAHYPSILAHIHRRTGDAHAAQDIAAETFIRAMNGLARYQPRGLSFRHWLLRIATNETNRFLHRAARRRVHEHAAGRTDAATRASPPASEAAEHVQSALLKLSTDHQTVIALHYFESLSVDDMARVLGCRVGTVKSRLSRARAALAELLGSETEGAP